MKRVAILVAIISCICVPAVRAQDHAEVGVFVDYFRLNQTSTNLVGLGARLSVNVVKHVQLEAEIAYDFNRAFNESFTDPTTETVTIQNSGLKALGGLFGQNTDERPRTGVRDGERWIREFPD